MENKDLLNAFAALMEFKEHHGVAFNSPSPSSTEAALVKTFNSVLMGISALADLDR